MSNRYRELIFTDHALSRLRERQIPLADAWYTWRRPDTTTKGKAAGSWKYTRSKGDQTMRVVAKQNEKKEWVVLSVWTKEKKHNKKKPVASRPLSWLFHTLFHSKTRI